jgi:hypothetical protein
VLELEEEEQPEEVESRTNKLAYILQRVFPVSQSRDEGMFPPSACAIRERRRNQILTVTISMDAGETQHQPKTNGKEMEAASKWTISGNDSRPLAY